MLISAIVPAFQASAFLDAALASIAAQDRAVDEVVVVDDASTDSTAAIAERWADVLPLRLLRKPTNEGLGAARRDAIAASTGELVALLDADDLWLPDHVRVLEQTWLEHGGIAQARWRWWVPGTQLASWSYDERSPVPPPSEQPREILRRNFLSCVNLFPRDLYERAGGFRPLRVNEDWDLWIRMIRNGARAHLPPTVTAFVRRHPASLSAADRCLPHDIALLEALLHDMADGDRDIVRTALRRRRARVHLLNGYEHARHGDRRAARAAWFRAAVTDRSVRQPFADGTGSVTLRALACAIAPERVVAARDRRAAAVDKRLRPG